MEIPNVGVTPTKTPISLLNEYMLRFGQTPTYQLISDSAGHDTFFQYVVTAGVVEETGSGRSKKEAKHDAAQKALNKLAKSDSVVRAQLLLTSGIPSERVASAVTAEGSVTISPYAEQVTDNSVGALAELCAQNQLEEPVYKIIGESGPAHSKTFSMMCKVLTLGEQGTGRTKKQAKQISAKRMIGKINEHLAMASSTILPSKESRKLEKLDFEEKCHQAAIDGYTAIKEKERGVAPGKNVTQTLSKCHLALVEVYNNQLSTLRAYASSHTAKETLSMFAEGHGLILSYFFVKSNTKGISLCAANLTTLPELVQFGQGSDPSSAEEMASINLLRALMIMIANSRDERV